MAIIHFQSFPNSLEKLATLLCKSIASYEIYLTFVSAFANLFWKAIIVESSDFPFSFDSKY